MKSIYIIPFELPWNWTADYQKQTILELNNKNKKVIAYMNKDACFFLKRKNVFYPKIKSVIFFQPIYFFPFQRFLFIKYLNQFLNLLFLKILFFKEKIYFWSFDPDFFKMAIYSNFLRITTIYDCVDFHDHIEPKQQQKIRDMENKLIKSVKYFFVNSKELFKIHSKTRFADAIVPQGFSLNLFKNKIKKINSISLLKKNKKPIIGFVGGINYRLDYDLLIKLAKRNKNWRFIFWGPIQKQDNDQLKNIQKKQDELFSLENVYTNKSLKKTIPSVIEYFDVCIIPYKKSYLFNLYSYPMKVFEYFYKQKPVISSEINELKTFPKNLISISCNYEEWEKSIKKSIKIKESQKNKKIKRQMAINNSWKKKVGAILDKIK